MFMLMTEVMGHYPLAHSLATECLSNGVADDAETFVALDTFLLCTLKSGLGWNIFGLKET